MKRRWTDEQLIEAVSTSTSYAEICRKLGLVPIGGSYKSVKSHVHRLHLSTDHLTGQAWNKGKKVTCNPGRPLEEILVENSFYSTTHLKERLFKAKIFEQKCYHPDHPDEYRYIWNNQPIPVELEHINGINTDNRLENLTILCHLCHAQTKTYRGRNATAYKDSKEISYQKYLLELDPEQNIMDEVQIQQKFILDSTKKINNVKPKIKKVKFCNCGKEISQKAITCKSCSVKITKIQWPSNEELEKMVWETPRSQLAKQLGVSDKAIAKRCDKLGISQPPRGYWMKNK